MLEFPTQGVDQPSEANSLPVAQLLIDFLASKDCTAENFAALELILFHATGQDLAERVIGALLRAESRSNRPWDKDDYRVAAKTVLYAALGYADPWNRAFFSYYGKPLASALAYWAERDRLTEAALRRCEQLVLTASLPPKKPAQARLAAKCKCGSLLLRHYKFCAECGKERAA